MKRSDTLKVWLLAASVIFFTELTGQKKVANAIDQLMDVSFQSDSAGLVNAIDELDRLSTKPDQEYLMRYYTAFGKWQSVLRQSNVSPQNSVAIGLINSAIKDLERSISLQPDFAEAYALIVNCYFVVPFLEPQRRMEMNASVSNMLNKATELDPQNPRVVLTQAQNIFYTPEQFGGSQLGGIEKYREAIQLFEKDEANALMPAWGHEIAYAWLGNAFFLKKDPNLLLAREFMLKSLELRPDFAWVKNTVMPVLEKQIDDALSKN